EQIQKGAIGIPYLLRDIRIDQRAEYQRRLVLLLGALIDPQRGCRRFLQSVQKRNTYGLEFNLFKLGQHRIAESFGGNAGAVGDDENRAFDKGGGHGIKSVQKASETVQSQRLTVTVPASKAGLLSTPVLPPGITRRGR